MPAFLHRPVPSFDGDIMTEGIERTANKLIARSIYWTAVQFSSGLDGGEKFSLGARMQGGCKGHAMAGGRINKPHSPPAKIFRPSPESNKTRAKAKAKASFE